MAEEHRATDRPDGGHPAPLPRFMPAITFAVRAAALAGTAVSAGALAYRAALDRAVRGGPAAAGAVGRA